MFTASMIPMGESWADTLYEEEPVLSSTEESVCSQEWETVGVAKMQTFVRAPRWCKHGNACIWQNCPFRHERCEHHDKWVSSRGRTRGCRCLSTDPRSCKSPEQGGCKYDHRDLRDLAVYHKSLPCNTEAELWDSFYQRGLEAKYSDAYDVSAMSSMDRSLLIRSLNANCVQYDEYDTWMRIYLD